MSEQKNSLDKLIRKIKYDLTHDEAYDLLWAIIMEGEEV